VPAVVYVDRIEGADALMTRLAGHRAEAHKVMVNFLRALSVYIKGQAQKNLNDSKHVKTRQTLQSIDSSVDSATLSARIGVNNIVGLFLEKGTQPHPIAVRNAMALMLPVASFAGSFSLAGASPFVREASRYRATGSLRAGRSAQAAFRSSVHHPGQKSTPFLYPAYQSSTPFREALLMKAGLDITEFLAHGI
jgi:hypothetical protein